MKAVLLVATAIGLLALMTLGVQLIGGAEEGLPDEVATSPRANATAGSVQALMLGASALPYALLLGGVIVVVYGVVRAWSL